jgi:signal transduction histidine kinase
VRLHLRPLAVLVVIAISIFAASLIGVAALREVNQVNESATARRSALIAETLAARLFATPPELEQELLDVVSRRTGVELVVFDREGRPLRDAALEVPNAERLALFGRQRDGYGDTRLGRARFHVTPVGPLPAERFLIAFVLAPERSESSAALLSALLGVFLFLSAGAAIVMLAVGRDAGRDIAFVSARIASMARVRSGPTGEPIPLRSIDEAGHLTQAFNDLVARFAGAQAAYSSDLSRAQAADRERSAFLAAVSHELRTPLNAILGFADVLLSGVDGPLTPDDQDNVTQVRGSGRHLLGLINDILELSALESGQLKIHLEPVGLNGIAAAVVREAAILAADRPVEVKLVADEQVTVLADPRRLRQIVTNLVSNAVKFTERGEITVIVRSNLSSGTLTVRDTGPGIAPEESVRIFQEFRQTLSERQRRRGTGLGLAITRRLVAMHNGRLDLESEPGRGSAFTVSLPMVRK